MEKMLRWLAEYVESIEPMLTAVFVVGVMGWMVAGLLAMALGLALWRGRRPQSPTSSAAVTASEREAARIVLIFATLLARAAFGRSLRTGAVTWIDRTANFRDAEGKFYDIDLVGQPGSERLHNPREQLLVLATEPAPTPSRERRINGDRTLELDQTG